MKPCPVLNAFVKAVGLEIIVPFAPLSVTKERTILTALAVIVIALTSTNLRIAVLVKLESVKTGALSISLVVQRAHAWLLGKITVLFKIALIALSQMNVGLVVCLMRNVMVVCVMLVGPKIRMANAIYVIQPIVTNLEKIL